MIDGSTGSLAKTFAPTIVRERPLVLHVDDDETSCLLAEESLVGAGFDVEHAHDGLQAIEQFHKHTPDLIIMDAMMPNMDGFEAIAHIRESASGRHVPILMITGLDDLDSINRAYDEGATDFLTKPVNYFVLPHRVQYILRSKYTADELRASQARLDNAQRIARLGHWEWCVASGALSWSNEFARILQLSSKDRCGQWEDLLDRVEALQSADVRVAADQAVQQATGFSIEFTLRKQNPSASTQTIRLESEPHVNDTGDTTHMVGTMQDITERTNAQKQIHDLAYFDLITGLPNRAQLQEKLNFTLKLSERAGAKFALLFLDLDHFKQVNDTLGHDAGDDLLRQVSSRLTSVLRDSDAVTRSRKNDDESQHKHTIARLGGDEFVVLLGQIAQAEDAARVAERIAKSISEPYFINDVEVTVTTTIGISVYPADGRNADTLMKHADVAMYHAKEQGRNGYQFYSRGIHEKALARFSMERELKHAIEHGELSLLFQPKIDIHTCETIGVEALVRWEHPESGVISPAEFIPLAEDTGLILPLGQWVMRESCQQMKTWISQGMVPLSMAVNCSPLQFIRGNMIRDIHDALDYSGLDPRLLEVELTESLFLHNIEKGIKILHRMKELGIQIAVDDFGTGFSSLSYLKRLPVNKLKIDQSFVRNVHNDKGDAAIVSAIIALSHNLNLTVVAEGVESQAQLDTLRKLNCNEIQGYLVSYPLSADEFFTWVNGAASHHLESSVG